MGIYIELPKDWAKYEIIVTDFHDNELEAKVTDLDLVRCGECKYYYPYKHYDGRILGYHCQAPNQQTDFLEPTHYCGFGERRADE